MNTGLPKLSAISPVSLVSPAVALGNRSTGVADLSALTHTLRSAMVVDTITFYVRHTSAANAANGFNWLAGSIGCKLNLGRFDLTNNLVPIWNMGHVIDDSFENRGNGTSIFVANAADTVGFYKWKLPVPLIVRPGESIIPYLERQNDGLGGTANVFIGLNGRVLSEDQKIPAQIPIPFISAWNPTIASGITYAINDQDAFKNRFKVPLRVQRFIGRLRFTPAASSTGMQDTPVEGSDNAATPIVVKCTDSKGYQIIGDFTPWAYAFPQVRRSFVAGNMLQPNEAYTFEVDKLPSDATITPQISMAGWRMEAY